MHALLALHPLTMQTFHLKTMHIVRRGCMLLIAFSWL